MTGGGVPYIDRGEPLPMSYAENRVVAMVRDPEYVFAYWDVDTETRIAGQPVVLRVHCLCEGRHFDIDVGPETLSWHLGVTPNRSYRLELHEQCPSGGLRLLATSEEVTSPVRWAGESGDETPAEILHAERRPLSRQKRPMEGTPHRILRRVVPADSPVVPSTSKREIVHTASVRSGGL